MNVSFKVLCGVTSLLRNNLSSIGCICHIQYLLWFVIGQESEGRGDWGCYDIWWLLSNTGQSLLWYTLVITVKSWARLSKEHSPLFAKRSIIISITTVSSRDGVVGARKVTWWFIGGGIMDSLVARMKINLNRPIRHCVHFHLEYTDTSWNENICWCDLGFKR